MESKSCIIAGVDIWKQTWRLLPLMANVGNAKYAQTIQAYVYAVDGGKFAVFFAAVEVRMCCYDIYIPFTPTRPTETDDPIVNRAHLPEADQLDGFWTHEYDLPCCPFSELMGYFEASPMGVDVWDVEE